MTETTKDRILDAAESLFAEHGFTATSMRAITAEAGANVASVNYHFGSKDSLIRDVLARRADPVNRERLRLLQECVDAAGDDPPPVEAIIHAFVWPPLQMFEEKGPIMMRLLGKMHGETDEHLESIMIELFGEVGRAFGQQLQRGLPHLSRADLAWRFLFMLGSMAFAMTDRQKLKFISGGTAKSGDSVAARDHLVAFIAAGMHASVPKQKKAGQAAGGPK